MDKKFTNLFCKQFESFKIRQNICLGGLSNAVSDQIGFGGNIKEGFAYFDLIFTKENISYLYSILIFIFFIRKIIFPRDVIFKSIFIIMIYLPVFFVTVDWGRWLIVIFSSLLVLFALSDLKIKTYPTKFDLFYYLFVLFSLKHYGTRGVSYLDFNYLFDINIFILFFILMRKTKQDL